MTDIANHNREAWNKQARKGDSPWVQPVDTAVIDATRKGEWSVVLTPTLPVPAEWFGDLKGRRMLGLASGGGQQMPIFAAAGAQVTLLDNSDEQLARDLQVAEREGLEISCERGDMADLSRFADASFDLIFHPCSNSYVPNVVPVWAECHRVLAPGGRLLAGFMNPAIFIFDWEAMDADGSLDVKYELPYADSTSLTPTELEKRIADGEPLEFGHSLDDQIGGQIKAGFSIQGFHEDHWGDGAPIIDKYMPCAIATLAIKS